MPAKESALSQHVESLYVEHHRWLHSWLRSRIDCSQQAADFLQDTFIRVLGGSKAEECIPDIREPRSYLSTIASRILIDHFRRKTLEKSYFEALAALSEEVEISPEQHAIMLESLQELDAMLSGLGNKIRRAFLLSQLKGMSYADIAKDLNVSVSSVKKYMAKATAACLIFSFEVKITLGA